MVPFFITGLPRSGTAWLANLFSPGKAICFHEPPEVRAPHLFKGLVSSNAGRRVGASGANLVRQYPAITKCWPQARWLYVTRPIEEVLPSLIAFTRAAGVQLDEGEVRAALEEDVGLGLKLLLDSERVAGVEWRDVTGNLEVAQAAWHWLCPEIRFDRERWEILRRLNVQQDFRLELEEHMRLTADKVEDKGKIIQIRQVRNS